jgi:hypothetical protein
MLTAENKINLADLNYHSYLDTVGIINPDLEGKIGIYAIFEEDKNIQYIGYSRNLLKSLQQHLIRKVDQCYWYKVYIIDRPDRSLLEGIRNDWIQQNQALLSDEEEQKQWTQPIDIKQQMTATEKEEYKQADELNQIKILKQVARKVETEIKQKLEIRGVTINMRFNPKLKEEGLLDLK